MPEYLAPGVIVEETSFRQKSIEGVSTSTTGYVGPTRFGPTEGEPPLLTSFSDFERIYGGLDQLRFESYGQLSHNYLAHAVRAYFEEGGRRLYVARVFEADSTNPDGLARAGLATPSSVSFRSRYPGAAGNFTARITFRASDNMLVAGTGSPVEPARLAGARPQDVVLATLTNGNRRLLWVDRFVDPATGRPSWRLRDDDPETAPVLTSPSSVVTLDQLSDARVITASLTVQPVGRFGEELVWEDLAFGLLHRDQSLSSLLAEEPTRRSIELFVPLTISGPNQTLRNGADLAAELLGQASSISQVSGSPPVTLADALADSESDDEARTLFLELQGGNDGDVPDAGAYEGQDGTGGGDKSGLRAFEDLENISIVAAPGASFAGFQGDASVDPIIRLLIGHCERMRYRIAVLDSISGQILQGIQDIRGTIDTTRAALYYPWVRIFDPVTESEVLQPPSGFVCGIYARNDVERGVHKAPANEVVRLAIGFETLINKGQQEVLNPKGINCLRFFEGRGFRVWGARTATSDPEWKYVNVRRYFAFLERSIEKGTQWAVFENNGDVLWSNIRRTIEDFLFNEWKENHLMGTKPEQAYFVRCDRTTMTQNDIDNGRLICLIGVAPLRPAEFVIFRIGQKTADA